MDLGYLLRILARRKWLIFSVMLGTMVAMYILIGRQPEMYRASVIVSTGIVNYKGINSDNSDAFVQEYQVQNAFSNLIEVVQSRSAIKLLTIRMLKHDLGAEGDSAVKPFRKANFKLSKFTPEEQQRLLTEINQLNLDSISDPSFSQQFDYLLDKVSRAYGYDHDAMRRSIEVKRKGDTDYLTLDFVTEKDSLSHFMADTYVSQFLLYYQNLRQRENKHKVDFYNQLTEQKQMQIDSIDNRIFDYRKAKGLATFDEQAKDLVSQISQLKIKRQSSLSKKDASKTSVTKLDGYIADKQSLYSEETRDRVTDKYQVSDLKEKVNILKQESIRTNGKNPKVEKELREAELAMVQAISETSRSVGRKRDKVREEGIKDDLYKTKVDVDLQGVDASSNVKELDGQIAMLTNDLKRFVADDQTIMNMSNDKELRLQEFAKLNDGLIEARLKYQTNENPLHVIENAQFPEWPEGNKQTLLSVFAGIVTGTFTVIFLFLLAYFDSSIQSPVMFKKYTELPLMGAMNAVSMKKLDLKQVFSTNGEMPQYTEFREALRKMRTLILQSNGKVFLFVSTKPKEGKSFTMNALAHSLAANNKRVLLLDTNFKNATLSQFAEEPSSNSPIINRAIRDHGMTDVFQLKNNTVGFSLNNVDVVGNTGRHQSPVELLDQVRFKQFLADLSECYDYIFLEAAAMNTYSDARELVQFADKVIAVFNAGSVIQSMDKDSIEFLQSMNGKFAGSVLTEVDIKNMN